jgi:hypothetical protein
VEKGPDRRASVRSKNQEARMDLTMDRKSRPDELA